jgi:hypothetical protein
MPRKSAGRARPVRSKRGTQVAPLADAVERNHELIAEVLAGVGAKRAGVRLGASKALRILSERVPELIYPHFDFFAALLSHDNHILRVGHVRWQPLAAKGAMGFRDKTLVTVGQGFNVFSITCGFFRDKSLVTGA